VSDVHMYYQLNVLFLQSSDVGSILQAQEGAGRLVAAVCAGTCT